jgi:hypothetical protein
MQERGTSTRVRSIGPFTGRQLTTIICVAIVAMATIPTAASAARAAFTSNSSAPTLAGKNTHADGIGVQGTGKRYGVYSNGPLGVADGKKLRCDGCVAPKALSSDAQVGRLQSGQSMSGPYALQIVAPGLRFVYAAVEYPRPLAASIPNNHFVYAETWPVLHCDGPGKADRGFLCAYNTIGSENISPSLTKLVGAGTAAGRTGTIIAFAPEVGSDFTQAAGSYTITAP